MTSYKLVTYCKNGSSKAENFAFKDLSKALRKLKRSVKSCELWYVLDGKNYRLVERNFSEVD